MQGRAFFGLNLNWFTMLIILCRIYQVANVKSEWNVIKTFPDLSGTGSVLFLFFFSRLSSYSFMARIEVHVCTVSKMLLELDLCRESHVCKIWRRFKILSGWINGPESSNIWPARRRYTRRILKCLSCIVLGFGVIQLLPTIDACLIPLVGKVNESFDLLWLFSLGPSQSHDCVFMWDGASYSRLMQQHSYVLSTDLKNRL